MLTKIQFSRGNFSTFLSRAASNVDNPLPPTVIANRAAEKLLKDFDILVQPDDLMYDEGCALKGDFDVNQVREKIRAFIRKENLDWDLEEVFGKFCSELDEECREINLKRAFPAGMPFINMDGDKVDLIISCGDNYIARLPMERMTIDRYIDLKNPSKDKIKPTDDTKNNWRKEIVDYLKNVKCQDSDEQQEINGLIDTINSFNSDYSNTTKNTEINHDIGRDIGLDMMSEQLERFFKSLKDKNIKPIIYDHKIMLVRVEESELFDGVKSIRISATPSKDPETCIMSIFNKEFKTINLED